jgi:hypothetical protein
MEWSFSGMEEATARHAKMQAFSIYKNTYKQLQHFL